MSRKSSAVKNLFFACLMVPFVCTVLFVGCNNEDLHPLQQTKNKASSALVFIDDLDRRVHLAESPKRVVALSASFAETWLLSGGTLAGTTSDAHSRKTFTLERDVLTIGSIKDPNSEAIIAIEPDFVLLSADIPSHRALSPLLTECAIAHAYFHVETMDDYLGMLQRCTYLTGREDLYRTNGLDVQYNSKVLLATHEKRGGTYLLLRSYSTQARAKGGDTMVAAMLGDYGYTNLTDLYPSLLEELSMETILSEDPTYIFVIPMGDERTALATIAHMRESSPAFAALSAVQQGRYHVLPKELFHYKPNNRWEDSYAYLAKLLSQ